MKQNEGDRIIPCIAQNVFEVQYVAVVQAKEVADANGRVKVDGQMQAASFSQQVTENEILKGGVFLSGGRASVAVTGVHRSGLRLRGIGEVERTEIGGFKLDRDTAVLAIEFQNARHEAQVFVE